MKQLIKNYYMKQQFFPSQLLGVWLNPYFLIRRGLLKGIIKISEDFKGGKLLDIGCGSKPYEKLFEVNKYIGIDVEATGHDHINSTVDFFYDGKTIPFPSEEFDWAFASEVFEHVFNIDELLAEINRVLKIGGCLGFTCPFSWSEHEQPYDYARYSSFAIKFLLEKHGFEVVYYNKTHTRIETIMQLLSAYVWESCLPKHVILRIILSWVSVCPINILGQALSYIAPDDQTLFLNNIVIAKKI